jgi:hypothetical protein
MLHDYNDFQVQLILYLLLHPKIIIMNLDTMGNMLRFFMSKLVSAFNSAQDVDECMATFKTQCNDILLPNINLVAIVKGKLLPVLRTIRMLCLLASKYFYLSKETWTRL